MNRTTTIVVALIAAAGLSTMVYAVPAQRALAWGGGFFGGCGGWGGCGGFGSCGFGWGGCGGGFFGGCGFGCGGGFFVHKTRQSTKSIIVPAVVRIKMVGLWLWTVNKVNKAR
jgi:hypothetical protein